MPGTPTLGDGLIRTVDLLDHLRADIESAYALLEEDRTSQFRRRCVVRAVFSYIEALVECIKVEIRLTVRLQPEEFSLSDREREVLGPLSVIGATVGKFLPLDENVKSTFRLAAKVWTLDSFQLATNDPAYKDFIFAKSARNRLTHPRTYYDIEVTDYDMYCHTVAGMWVQSEFARLFRARQDSILSHVSHEEQGYCPHSYWVWIQTVSATLYSIDGGVCNDQYLRCHDCIDPVKTCSRHN